MLLQTTLSIARNASKQQSSFQPEVMFQDLEVITKAVINLKSLDALCRII